MQYLHQIAVTANLKPNPWNPNQMSPENEAKLETSIKRFGMFRPLVVRTLPDGSLELLGGQHRWEIASRLSLPEVPVINLGQISDDKAKEISLADNGRYGVDDAGRLNDLFKSLDDVDALVDFLPYTSQDLQAIFATSNIDLNSLHTDDEIDLGSHAADISAGQTHQIMRFKVPSEDAERISDLINTVIKAKGFTDSDALTNAGDALVHILLRSRDE